MLKYEDNSEIRLPTASQVRVAPEELTAAISRLEARKDVSQRSLDGTIAIGEAVEQLGLEATPDEVLAEVNAGRVRQVKSKKQRLNVRHIILMFAITGSLLGLAVNSSILTQAESGQIVSGRAPYQIEPRLLALIPALPKPVIETLAEAPEGKTLYCSVDAVDTAALSRNDREEPQKQISQSVAEMNWPVVKHDKQLYVRGWMRLPLSKDAAKISVIEVYNKPNTPQLGINSQPVTLKLDGWNGFGYQRLNPDGTGKLVFTNPRLDAHTYEKWQP